MSEVSNEEIIAIANNFLLNSPPGEFNEVVTDVRGLLRDDSIINETAPTTFREYNTEQFMTVQSPAGDHQVLITKFGEVSDSEYLDPRGGLVLTYDHIRQECTGSRAIAGELEHDVEHFRAAFDHQAVAYVGEHYQNGATTVYGSKNDHGQNVVTVCISSSKYNPSNFWNGRWRSLWTVTFGNSGQAQLVGTVKVTVHYYEDGNVQLNTNTTLRATAPVSDADSFATNAFKAISKAEQTYQTSLEQSYNTMGETTFKALRRALPITRTKIDWPKILTYKLSKDMSSRT